MTPDAVVSLTTNFRLSNGDIRKTLKQRNKRVERELKKSLVRNKELHSELNKSIAREEKVMEELQRNLDRLKRAEDAEEHLCFQLGELEAETLEIEKGYHAEIKSLKEQLSQALNLLQAFKHNSPDHSIGTKV